MWAHTLLLASLMFSVPGSSTAPASFDLDGAAKRAAMSVAGLEQPASTNTTVSTRAQVRVVAGWTAVGLGVAAMTTAGVFIGFGHEANTLRNLPIETHTQVEAQEADRRANELSEYANILFVSALVAGGATLISTAVWGTTYDDRYWDPAQ